MLSLWGFTYDLFSIACTIVLLVLAYFFTLKVETVRDLYIRIYGMGLAVVGAATLSSHLLFKSAGSTFVNTLGGTILPIIAVGLLVKFLFTKVGNLPVSTRVIYIRKLLLLVLLIDLLLFRIVGPMFFGALGHFI